LVGVCPRATQAGAHTPLESVQSVFLADSNRAPCHARARPLMCRRLGPHDDRINGLDNFNMAWDGMNRRRVLGGWGTEHGGHSEWWVEMQVAKTRLPALHASMSCPYSYEFGVQDGGMGQNGRDADGRCVRCCAICCADGALRCASGLGSPRGPNLSGNVVATCSSHWTAKGKRRREGRTRVASLA